MYSLEYGLVDYPQIIKKPMDIGTVKKNLKNNKYKYVEEGNAILFELHINSTNIVLNDI